MPFSPAQIQQIALEMRRLYGDAEIAIIERITRSVAQDMDAPDWAQRKQQDIRHLRTAVEREIATLNRQGVTEMDRVVREAYRSGSQSAVADLRRVMAPEAINTSFSAANERAIRRFVQEGVTGIQSTHTRILRQADDVFRKVVADASGMGVTGVQTRRQVAQQALNQFANAGITGFRDSAGRNWDIASYTEMATRTTMTRAAIEGTTDRFRENGQDLVIISALGESCPLCDPHEGQIYSLSGDSDQYPALNSAIADGLFHPNCRHDADLWVEGLSTKPDRPPKETREDRYENLQEQRANERAIRQWKRREAAALDDDERASARAKVREWQARQRDLVEETGQRRKYERESVTRAR